MTKKDIGLEFVLEKFKKLVDKHNFKVYIPVTLLKDGTLTIENVDVSVKKFLGGEDVMSKMIDLRDLADQIVDNTRGTFRLNITAETPEYDEDGYRYFPNYDIYRPLIYSGVEIGKIEFTDESKKKIAEDKEKRDYIFIWGFRTCPDSKIYVAKIPYYDDYGIVADMQEFIEYRERIKGFLLENFEVN